jgi:uncharacterized protein YqfA (UPF0365 family)
MPVLLAQGLADLGPIIAIAAAVFILFFMLIVVAVFANYFRLWIQSFLTGAGITIWDLIGMTFRKVNKDVIVKSKIMAVQAGLSEDEGITSKALEAHALAGGNVPLVIRSLIAAAKAKIIRLSFREATAIDLAGRNVLEAVQTSVYPKVIDCPGRGSGTLDAVARNGIQLKVRARVTVRANLQRVIGGATEETIIARVGEGIVSAIGKADDHMQVLENPDQIAAEVLGRQLDANTAFEIVSIDIADIDVGENVGARLRADQAEADTRVARARAEGRRAAAVASEQEQYARIEESRAKLVEAEAEVPKAMADSFRTGRLGILDYYKLRNVQADTDMRRAIAGSGAAGGSAGQATRQ